MDKEEVVYFKKTKKTQKNPKKPTKKQKKQQKKEEVVYIYNGILLSHQKE